MTTRIKPSVLANTTVTVGTYGNQDSNNVASYGTSDNSTANTRSINFTSFTVDAQGRLTYANTKQFSMAASGNGLDLIKKVNSGIYGLEYRSNGTAANTANTLVYRDAASNFSANEITANQFKGNATSANSVANGVYTTSTYINPSWISSLANTKITGTFPTGSITGLANSATTDTTNAGNITSGTLPAARLPNSGVSATSVGSASSVSRFTVDAYGRITSANSTTISITKSQISDFPTIPEATTNASSLTSGTLSAARLPYTMNQAVSTANNVQFNSLGVGTVASTTTGEIRAANNITAYYSDERLKKDITPINNALDKVMQLRGVTFHANEVAEKYGYSSDKEQVGVIAQDVQKVLPQIIAPAPFDRVIIDDVETSRSGQEYMTVHYEKLIPLLIEAIKEQQKQIDALKNK